MTTTPEDKINQTVSTLQAVLNNVDPDIVEQAKQKFCGSNTPALADTASTKNAASIEPENQTETQIPGQAETSATSQGGRRRSKRRSQKKPAKKSKKGGRSRKNCGSKNRRKYSRRR